MGKPRPDDPATRRKARRKQSQWATAALIGAMLVLALVTATMMCNPDVLGSSGGTGFRPSQVTGDEP